MKDKEKENMKQYILDEASIRRICKVFFIEGSGSHNKLQKVFASSDDIRNNWGDYLDKVVAEKMEEHADFWDYREVKE